MPTFFQKLKKTVPSLRVNEIKGTSRNDFIDNAYELQSEKKSRKDERTIFQDCHRVLDLSVNPLAPIARYMCFTELC